jgi:hypothetical protein
MVLLNAVIIMQNGEFQGGGLFGYQPIYSSLMKNTTEFSIQCNLVMYGRK